MEFRLTYEGQLHSESQRDSKVRAARTKEKQEIRKQLHPQLRHWWEISPYLALGKTQPNLATRPVKFGNPYAKHGIDTLAKRFSRNGYNFVPLVMRELELFCHLDVLLLRQGSARNVLEQTDNGGDIDNRFKVLFDALSMPRDANQLAGYLNPAEDEKPFFVLLEDDSVITKATIESDFLLQPVSNPPNPNDVRVVITVRIKPARLLVENAGYA